MESVVTSRRADSGFWAGKRVFLTGHSGFKGTWARLWLSRMGAVVTGFALAPEDSPSLDQLVGGAGTVRAVTGDIRDAAALREAIVAADPEILLHMAAQALVRRGYADPAETFDVNVTGTVRVLEAARAAPSLRALLVVTTDKVYRNDESGRAFSEGDTLGGHDPYSASKAASELAVSSYAASFFAAKGVRCATARGGNVIGGGDFARDRLVPDVVRAVMAGDAPKIRDPSATRPWQHVLDCLNGYFLFAEGLHENRVDCAALNFGPPLSERSVAVGEVAEALQARLAPGTTWRPDLPPPDAREMHTLALDPSKAAETIGWRSQLTQRDAIAWTAAWYERWRSGEDAARLTLDQIARFTELS